MSCFKHCVSQERNRYVKDGFDLDLTYITEHIIVSGCPSFSFEQIYRNPHQQLKKFLKQKHGDNYVVFNLCSEKSRIYGKDVLGPNVYNFPFQDHHAPSLQLICQFVHKATEKLMLPQKPVLFVHCKAGQGRSGCMVVCLLLYLSFIQRMHKMSAFQALELFKQKRGQGIKYPSQIRKVFEFQQLCLSSGIGQLHIQFYILQQQLKVINISFLSRFKNVKLSIMATCSTIPLGILLKLEKLNFLQQDINNINTNQVVESQMNQTQQQHKLRQAQSISCTNVSNHNLRIQDLNCQQELVKTNKNKNSTFIQNTQVVNQNKTKFYRYQVSNKAKDERTLKRNTNYEGKNINEKYGDLILENEIYIRIYAHNMMVGRIQFNTSYLTSQSSIYNNSSKQLIFTKDQIDKNRGIDQLVFYLE